MADREKSAVEVAALFDLAAGAGEPEVIAALDGCVERIHGVQQAKADLSGLSAEEIRAAPEYRRRPDGPTLFRRRPGIAGWHGWGAVARGRAGASGGGLCRVGGCNRTVREMVERWSELPPPGA